jgi:hypothetical protein
VSADANDLRGLEASVDPDGSLAETFEMTQRELTLPEHEWVLSALVPVARKDIDRLVAGRRFRFGVPAEGVRTAVLCVRCQTPFEQMTPREQERCRG